MECCTNSMFLILKVTEHSMEPEYQEGDYLLVSKIPFFFRKARPGDVVAFHKLPHGLLVKKVEYLTPAGELFMLGTNPLSVDSLQFGPIHPRDLLGKVIGHVTKSRQG